MGLRGPVTPPAPMRGGDISPSNSGALQKGAGHGRGRDRQATGRTQFGEGAEGRTLESKEGAGGLDSRVRGRREPTAEMKWEGLGTV